MVGVKLKFTMYVHLRVSEVVDLKFHKDFKILLIFNEIDNIFTNLIKLNAIKHSTANLIKIQQL